MRGVQNPWWSRLLRGLPGGRFLVEKRRPGVLGDFASQPGAVVSGLVGWALSAVPHLGGRSRLLEVGLQSGFASGVAIEHIYRGNPVGAGTWGRWLDGRLLRTAACRDLRARARAVVAGVRDWLRASAADPAGHADPDGRVVLDVAAGTGWLLREALLGCAAADVAGLRVVQTELVASTVDLRAGRVMLGAIAGQGGEAADANARAADADAGSDPGGGDPGGGDPGGGDPGAGMDLRVTAVSWNVFEDPGPAAQAVLPPADLIVLSGVMGMEADDGAAAAILRRLRRLAAPGGQLLVTFPVRYGTDWERWWTRYVPPPAGSRHRGRFRGNPRRSRRGWAGSHTPGYRGIGGGRPVAERSIVACLNLLREAGWEPVRCTPVGNVRDAADPGGNAADSKLALRVPDGPADEPRFVVVAAAAAGDPETL